MKMDNISNLFKRIDEQKPMVKPTKKWPWVGRRKFQPGRYRIRFLSHDEKCPNGFRIYTVHEVQKEACDRWSMTMDEQEKAYYKIMCTESYKGYQESEDGESKLSVPCPVCDVAHDIVETYAGEDIDEDLLKAVDEMSSNACRRFLYPVLIYASETEVTNDEGKKVKVWVPDNKNCVGIVLNLMAKNYEGNADLSMIKLFHEHVFNSDAETHLSTRRGRWFVWEKKSNGQSITPEDKGPLEDKEQENIAKLPNIEQFGMGGGESKFAKNYKVGYEKGKQYLSQSWFVKALVQHHDYQLDLVQRGLV